MASRILGATAMITATLVATAAPAAAHRCTSPAQIPVGKSSTVSVGVTIESRSPKYISVLIPTGMQVDQIFPASGGWTGRLYPPNSAKEVLYERGSLEPFSCAYFPIRFTAKARGVYVLSVDQLLPDNTQVRLPSSNDYVVLPNGKTTHPGEGGPPNPLFEQVVYAGVPVGTVPNAAGGGAVSVPNDGGGGSSWLTPVLLAVGVGGGLGVLWFALRFRDRTKQKRKPERLQLGESD